MAELALIRRTANAAEDRDFFPSAPAPESDKPGFNSGNAVINMANGGSP
jgi:hypothetical protein